MTLSVSDFPPFSTLIPPKPANPRVEVTSIARFGYIPLYGILLFLPDLVSPFINNIMVKWTPKQANFEGSVMA